MTDTSPLPELAAERPWYLPRTFDALRLPPFRFYMGAMMWWNAAMSMQMLVRGYLAYQLTNSFATLGILGLASAAPMLVLSPLGGVIADRTSRRTVLQVGQVFSVFITMVVASLLFTNRLIYWHLYVAAFAHGTVIAVVIPSRQALLPDVVGLRQLTNAVPLQAGGTNLMQILGPVLGGFMIDWFGAAWVYVSMGAMLALSVFLLSFVKTLPPSEMEESRVGAAAKGLVHTSQIPAGESTCTQLGRGFSYVRRDRVVLVILAFSFACALLGMPIRQLLPGYVGSVWGDDGSTLGILQMGMGAGALIGSLVLASLRGVRSRGLLLAACAIIVGFALVGFSLADTALVAWLALFCVGVGSSGRQVFGQVLLQEYADNAYRGRVMSIYFMQVSMMWVGTYIVSLYMESVGPEFAIGSLGVLLIVVATCFVVFVPRFRSIV